MGGRAVVGRRLNGAQQVEVRSVAKVEDLDSRRGKSECQDA